MNPAGSTIGSLLSELRDEGTTLLRQEVALAKAELAAKAAEAARASIGVVIGGAVAYAGAIVLGIGLGHLAHHGLIALGLSEHLARWLGFVIVGTVVAFIGWSMLAKAKRALNADVLAPRETIASLRDSQRWARDKIHSAPSSP